jgi:hypothetical protein
MGSFEPRPTDEQLTEMMDTIDIDHNGTIEFEEFLVLMNAQGQGVQSIDDEIMQAFQEFDENGDGIPFAISHFHPSPHISLVGFISFEELRVVMNKLGTLSRHHECDKKKRGKSIVSQKWVYRKSNSKKCSTKPTRTMILKSIMKVRDPLSMREMFQLVSCLIF